MATLKELLAKANSTSRRAKPRDQEHRLQAACVQWFNLQFPHLRSRLFAVPNGGRRDAVTGAKLKAEGVRAGVADLILLRTNARHGALLIEMKTPTGRQSERQKAWQQELTQTGEYRYVICRSLTDFQREVSTYLCDL